jgi:hypothetical protein
MEIPLSEVSGANVIAKRREELLPVEVFTESDSEPSNIAISSVAIAILCVVFGSVILFDGVMCVVNLLKRKSASYEVSPKVNGEELDTIQ